MTPPASRSLRVSTRRSTGSAVSTNVSNAISFSQTQDGYLKKIAKALDRMSELSVMAQDVTKSAADIALYETEFAAQAAFINDMATKEFNGVGLLDATDRDVTVDSEGATFTITGVDGSAYDLTGSDTTGAAASRPLPL
jgi:flagellin